MFKQLHDVLIWGPLHKYPGTGSRWLLFEFFWRSSILSSTVGKQISIPCTSRAHVTMVLWYTLNSGVGKTLHFFFHYYFVCLYWIIFLSGVVSASKRILRCFFFPNFCEEWHRHFNGDRIKFCTLILTAALVALVAHCCGKTHGKSNVSILILTVQV